MQTYKNTLTNKIKRIYSRYVIPTVAVLLVVVFVFLAFGRMHNSDSAVYGVDGTDIIYTTVEARAVEEIYNPEYTKAIENIRVGDYVKSYDEATGQVENKRVTQTFVNETYELTTIKTSDGQEIVSTPGHKYFANGSWISAEDLRAGDILVNVNGQKVVVESVQHEILESPVKIYNFEVQDNHTYFVGNTDGIAVHNAACSKPINARALTKGEAKSFDIHGFKESYVGRSNISKYDVYKDIADNDQLWLQQKQGGRWVETVETLADVLKEWCL